MIIPFSYNLLILLFFVVKPFFYLYLQFINQPLEFYVHEKKKLYTVYWNFLGILYRKIVQLCTFTENRQRE